MGVGSRRTKQKFAEEAQFRERATSEKLLIVLIWVLAVAGILAWLIPQTIRLIENKVGTTVSIQSESKLEFPTMTVCNFQANVTLGFLSCTQPDGTACFGALRDDTGDFVCYSFNTDRNTPLIVDSAGLRGLLDIKFLANTQLYPDGAALQGAQVILHALGTKPDLDKDAVFVPAGKATMLSIQRTETLHINGDVSKSWDPTPSTLSLDPDTTNKDNIIVLGILYKALSVILIEETRAFDPGDFVGGLAGMIGTMMGYDFLGLSMMAFMVVMAYKKGEQNRQHDRSMLHVSSLHDMEAGEDSEPLTASQRMPSSRREKYNKSRLVHNASGFLDNSNSSTQSASNSSNSSNSSSSSSSSSSSTSGDLPGTVASDSGPARDRDWRR